MQEVQNAQSEKQPTEAQLLAIGMVKQIDLQVIGDATESYLQKNAEAETKESSSETNSFQRAVAIINATNGINENTGSYKKELGYRLKEELNIKNEELSDGLFALDNGTELTTTQRQAVIRYSEMLLSDGSNSDASGFALGKIARARDIANKISAQSKSDKTVGIFGNSDDGINKEVVKNYTALDKNGRVVLLRQRTALDVNGVPIHGSKVEIMNGAAPLDVPVKSGLHDTKSELEKRGYKDVTEVKDGYNSYNEAFGSQQNATQAEDVIYAEPTQDDIANDISNKNFTMVMYASESEIPDQWKSVATQVKDWKGKKSFVVNLPSSQFNYELQNGTSKPVTDYRTQAQSEQTPTTTTPQDATVESAVIEIGGEVFEGKNHAEAILKAKASGKDISQVNRQAQGKFRLSDGTIIDRAEAKQRFGQDRSELMITQDEASLQANKDLEKEQLANTTPTTTQPQQKTVQEHLQSIQNAESSDVVNNIIAEVAKNGTPQNIIDFKSYFNDYISKNGNIDVTGIDYDAIGNTYFTYLLDKAKSETLTEDELKYISREQYSEINNSGIEVNKTKKSLLEENNILNSEQVSAINKVLSTKKAIKEKESKDKAKQEAKNAKEQEKQKRINSKIDEKSKKNHEQVLNKIINSKTPISEKDIEDIIASYQDNITDSQLEDIYFYAEEKNNEIKTNEDRQLEKEILAEEAKAKAEQDKKENKAKEQEIKDKAKSANEKISDLASRIKNATTESELDAIDKEIEALTSEISDLEGKVSDFQQKKLNKASTLEATSDKKRESLISDFDKRKELSKLDEVLNSPLSAIVKHIKDMVGINPRTETDPERLKKAEELNRLERRLKNLKDPNLTAKFNQAKQNIKNEQSRISKEKADAAREAKNAESKNGKNGRQNEQSKESSTTEPTTEREKGSTRNNTATNKRNEKAKGLEQSSNKAKPTQEAKIEQSTTQSESNPALRDVESTAKALEDIGNKKLEKTGIDETPTARDVDYGGITWQQSGLSSFNKGSDGKTYITDKDGNIYSILKTKVSANGTFLVSVKDTNGKEVGNFEFKKGKDGNFYAGEAFVTNKQNGIASIAYDYASKDGEKIKPSNRLKEDGIKFWSKSISKAYHKAKSDGSNPELVKSVESLLSKEQAKIEPNVSKVGFTESKDLNKIFSELKNKYGEKKGTALYEAANRLVNPNENTIVEIRGNGVVVKEGETYILKPFGNTDANSKKWTLYKGLDITDQFTKSESLLSDQTSKSLAQSTQKNDIKPTTNNESDAPFQLVSDTKPFETQDPTPSTKERIQDKFPDAIVVQSESELPNAIKEQIESQNASGKVKGVYYNGNVYMVADNIKTMGEAIGTYRHEQLGHKGVIDKLGKKIDNYAIQLVNNATDEQKEKLKEIAKDYFGDPNIDNLTDAQKSKLGQEYIAKIAETPSIDQTFYDKLKQFIKEALRAFGVPLDVVNNISDKEISALIKSIENSDIKSNNKQKEVLFKLSEAQEIRDVLNKAEYKSLYDKLIDRKNKNNNYSLTNSQVKSVLPNASPQDIEAVKSLMLNDYYKGAGKPLSDSYFQGDDDIRVLASIETVVNEQLANVSSNLGQINGIESNNKLNPEQKANKTERFKVNIAQTIANAEVKIQDYINASLGVKTQKERFELFENMYNNILSSTDPSSKAFLLNSLAGNLDKFELNKKDYINANKMIAKEAAKLSTEAGTMLRVMQDLGIYGLKTDESLPTEELKVKVAIDEIIQKDDTKTTKQDTEDSGIKNDVNDLTEQEVDDFENLPVSVKKSILDMFKGILVKVNENPKTIKDIKNKVNKIIKEC
jgi:hypothetical protein